MNHLPRKLAQACVIPAFIAMTLVTVNVVLPAVESPTESVIASSSTVNYKLVSSVFDSGGGSASSANYKSVGVIGHAYETGLRTSANYKLSSGFLQLSGPVTKTVSLPLIVRSPPAQCAVPAQDCGEPNNAAAAPFLLNSINTTIYAIANKDSDQLDFYAINAPAGTHLPLHLRATTGDLDLFIRDGDVNNTVVATSNTTGSSNEDISYTVLAGAINPLVIQVYAFDGTGTINYSLQIIGQ